MPDDDEPYTAIQMDSSLPVAERRPVPLMG